MPLKIDRFINPYKESNTYLVPIGDDKIVIIDLGNYPIELLNDYFIKNNKQLAAVFLTHEHSDHCSGINELAKYHDFDLYCSQPCAINIENEKQNLSFYIPGIETFKVVLKKKIVQDGDLLKLNDVAFEIVTSPGHSSGSICIFINEFVFTGDTILENKKSYLGFPHSNKLEYHNSINKLIHRINNLTILPGHGEKFKGESNELKKYAL